MRRFIRNEYQHETFCNLLFAFAQILALSKTKGKTLSYGEIQKLKFNKLHLDLDP